MTRRDLERIEPVPIARVARLGALVAEEVDAMNGDPS